ncbi:sensor histidine kinase [Nocardioides daejeonensis]|uniref:sensor histidine kinase n=1 Tax=Nocardioides daejeonensis TaxID=1046556 RepID=UPI000D7465B0|nr:ATP-binding protein [Nocardioides daejeonensis]
MWSPRSTRPRLSMAGQFLLLQLTILLIALAVASVASLRQSEADFRAQRAVPLRVTAQDLANLEVVRTQLSQRPVLQSLTSYAEQFRRRSGATVVHLTDAQGRILVSSDPTAVGRRVRLDESGADQGRTWSGDVQERGRTALAAHAPVFDAGAATGTPDGPRPPAQVGIVVVMDDYPSLADRAADLLPDLVRFLGLGLALGLIGAWLLSRLVKRRTRGLEPVEIAALADHREALLRSVREGVVAVGADGVITVLNDSARKLLDLDAAVGAEGTPVADLPVQPQVLDLLTGGGDQHDRVLVVGERVLVANRNPVRYGGRQVGAVTTLRDRTELLAMQSELTARESITETLRAQTHEFSNQLHMISGLVQLEAYDEVSALIGTLTRRRAEINELVTARVLDPAVAALLIAKISLAAERGIEVVLADTVLPHLDPDLSADVGTVLGNLVDNAIDATVAAGGRRIDVQLAVTEDAVAVQVLDTGSGVPPEAVDEIFRRGWSTKPSDASGRGVGLALVQVVCARRGGHVSVHNQQGAVFTAVLPMTSRSTS